MAVVVEDGTGVSGANSYRTLAEHVAFLNSLGLTAFGLLATDALREQHSLLAIRYLESAYRVRWDGRRTNKTQPLAWPRTGVTDGDDFVIERNEIPDQVKDAHSIACDRSIAGSLQPDLAAGSGSLQRKVSQLGPLKSDRTFGATREYKRFTEIDRLLSGFLTSPTEAHRA